MRKEITIIVPLGENSDSSVLEGLKSLKHKAHIIVEKGPNPSENRNRGIKKAKTPLVAFLNGHAIVKEDWIEKVLYFMKNFKEVDIVGGPQHNSPSESIFGRASGYAMSSPFGSGGVWRRYAGNKVNLDADELMLTSSNLICRKKVFNKVKFDTNLYPGEDPKFISDSKKAGFKVAYSPEIIVYNKRRQSFSSLSKQVFNYALSRTKFEKFKDTLKKPLFFVPSAFILYLLSLILFNHQLYLIPLYAYIALSILSSLYLPLKNKDLLAIPFMPLVFLTIQLSYGYGIIHGLVGKLK